MLLHIYNKNELEITLPYLRQKKPRKNWSSYSTEEVNEINFAFVTKEGKQAIAQDEKTMLDAFRMLFFYFIKAHQENKIYDFQI